MYDEWVLEDVPMRAQELPCVQNPVCRAWTIPVIFKIPGPCHLVNIRASESDPHFAVQWSTVGPFGSLCGCSVLVCGVVVVLISVGRDGRGRGGLKPKPKSLNPKPRFFNPSPKTPNPNR